MNKVAVLSLEKRFKKFEKIIKELALKILKSACAGRKKNVSAEIYLAGNQKMRFLNKKFRGKDKPTDVLSFEEPKGFIYPKSRFKPIGEVYINMTNDQRPTTNDSRELLVVSRRLLTHGLLHLLGYNHKKKSDRIRMEKKERLVIKKLSN